MPLIDKNTYPQHFERDTKFFRKGDEFTVDHEDEIKHRGYSGSDISILAVFGSAVLPTNIAERLDVEKLFVIAITIDVRDRPDWDRIVLYYKSEKMARNDWDNIKGAVLTKSPVLTEILTKRAKTKSVDVIE